jgi:hypothetical protein
MAGGRWVATGRYMAQSNNDGDSMVNGGYMNDGDGNAHYYLLPDLPINPTVQAFSALAPLRFIGGGSL